MCRAAGYRRVWHSGGITTFKSQVWLYPDEDIGLFASTNGPPNIDNTWGLIIVLQTISDVLLRETPWINATSACAFPSPWKRKSVARERTLRDDRPEVASFSGYAGTFRHPAFGEVNVSYNASERHLELRMGRFLRALLLYDKTRDVFHAKLVDRYGYEPFTLPVTFRNRTGSGEFDILTMPLSMPIESSEPVEFTKGLVGQETLYTEHREGEGRSGCVSKATALPVPACVVILSFLLVCCR